MTYDEKAEEKNQENEGQPQSSDGAVEGDAEDQSPPPQGISTDKPATG